MNKIVTRGFGRNSTRQGIITQGYGGILSSIIQAAGTARRRIVAGGKVVAEKVKQQIDDVIVRVTLLSINDKILDITGAEHGEIDKSFVKPRVSFSLIKKRIIEMIRLSVKRIK